MLKKITLMLAILLAGCTTLKNPPSTVAHVDLNKYAGKWYEISSFPNSFQRGCQCTTATYALQGDQVNILNRCYKGAKRKPSQAKGRAWPVNAANSQLKVQFFWPFRGDYWVLYLDPDYKQVLVGSPNRKYLWVLSRTPHISKERYQLIEKVAKRKGYDITKLVKTRQDCWKK